MLNNAQSGATIERQEAIARFRSRVAAEFPSWDKKRIDSVALERYSQSVASKRAAIPQLQSKAHAPSTVRPPHRLVRDTERCTLATIRLAETLEAGFSNTSPAVVCSEGDTQIGYHKYARSLFSVPALSRQAVNFCPLTVCSAWISPPTDPSDKIITTDVSSDGLLGVGHTPTAYAGNPTSICFNDGNYRWTGVEPVSDPFNFPSGSGDLTRPFQQIGAYNWTGTTGIADTRGVSSPPVTVGALYPPATRLGRYSGGKAVVTISVPFGGSATVLPVNAREYEQSFGAACPPIATNNGEATDTVTARFNNVMLGQPETDLYAKTVEFCQGEVLLGGSGGSTRTFIFDLAPICTGDGWFEVGSSVASIPSADSFALQQTQFNVGSGTVATVGGATGVQKAAFAYDAFACPNFPPFCSLDYRSPKPSNLEVSKASDALINLVGFNPSFPDNLPSYDSMALASPVVGFIPNDGIFAFSNGYFIVDNFGTSPVYVNMEITNEYSVVPAFNDPLRGFSSGNPVIPMDDPLPDVLGHSGTGNTRQLALQDLTRKTVKVMREKFVPPVDVAVAAKTLLNSGASMHKVNGPVPVPAAKLIGVIRDGSSPIPAPIVKALTNLGSSASSEFGGGVKATINDLGGDVKNLLTDAAEGAIEKGVSSIGETLLSGLGDLF